MRDELDRTMKSDCVEKSRQARNAATGRSCADRVESTRAHFPETKAEDVFGALPYAGPPKTIEDMKAGVPAEVKRRRKRD